MMFLSIIIHLFMGIHLFVRQAHQSSGDNASNISFKNNIIFKTEGNERLETIGCTYDYNNYCGVRRNYG